MKHIFRFKDFIGKDCYWKQLHLTLALNKSNTTIGATYNYNQPLFEKEIIYLNIIQNMINLNIIQRREYRGVSVQSRNLTPVFLFYYTHTIH